MTTMERVSRVADDFNVAEALDEISIHDNHDIKNRDTFELAKVGKKQVLKRRFGLISMVGFCCMVTNTWGATLLNLAFGLNNGGPAGLVYGYIITWIGTLSVFMVMAELSSMLPTAGGQYHWVSVLAPKRTKRLLSYVTGWATVISWVAATTASAYVNAYLLQGLVGLNNPSYSPAGWQGTLITCCMVFLSILVTTVLGSVLPPLEIALLILQILGFLATLLPLAYYAGSSGAGSKAETIFTTFFNFGGWNTQALSFFIGIQGNASALLGLDGAIHMAEEVEHSSRNVARSILYSVLLNGTLGFGILLAFLFAVDDLEALAQSRSPFPFMDILVQSLGSVTGTTVIVSVLLCIGFGSTICTLSSAGRMMWSFARDRGLPGWQWLRQVDRRTSIPFNTMFVATLATALLSLLNIGSTTIFQDVVSLVLEGFNTSYLFAVTMLLYRRVRGEIREPRGELGDITDVHGETTPDDQLPTWGPWRLPKWLGLANNIVAEIYLLIICFFSFWPEAAMVTPENMDYAVVVLGAVMIGSLFWYYWGAKKYYSGPIVEVRVATARSRYIGK